MGCTIQIKVVRNVQDEEAEDSDEIPSRFSKKNKLIDNYFKARELELEYEERQRKADEEEAIKKRKRFSEQPNFLKLNIQGQDKFNLLMDEKRYYQQNRRRVLDTFVAHNQREIDEFNHKYKYFMLHKWEILKSIKETELQRKRVRNTYRKQCRDWLIMRALSYHITRTWQIFDRQKVIKKIEKKKWYISFVFGIKMMQALKKNGQTLDIRTQRQIRSVLASTGGGLIRNTQRERAKAVVHRFLSEQFEREYILAKVRKTVGHVVFIQRMVHLNQIQKKIYQWSHKEVKDQARLAGGLQNFWLALMIHTQKKNREAVKAFEQSFESLKTIKQNVKDDERLDQDQKQKLEEEAEDLNDLINQ